MSKDGNLDDEFEYHDGLGDLLKEKERQEFSWPKTIIVLASFVIILALSFLLILQIGKSLFIKDDQKGVENRQAIDLEKSVSTTTTVEHQLTQSKPELPETQVNVPKMTTTQPAPVQKKIVNKPAPVTKKQSVAQETYSPHALYRVITGSFLKRSDAEKMLRDLKRKGVDCYIWVYRGSNRTVYRVQVGAFKKLNRARVLEASFKKKGIDAYIVRK